MKKFIIITFKIFGAVTMVFVTAFVALVRTGGAKNTSGNIEGELADEFQELAEREYANEEH